MAGWDDQSWESSILEGLPRREGVIPDRIARTSRIL